MFSLKQSILIAFISLLVVGNASAVTEVSPEISAIHSTHQIVAESTDDNHDSKLGTLANLAVLTDQSRARVYLVDSDKMEIVNRFQFSGQHLRQTILSRSGEAIYLLFADGWVYRMALTGTKQTHKIKVGESSADMALSHDNRYLMVGNQNPHSAVVLNAHNLHPLKYFPIHDGYGMSSSVTAVKTNPKRETFALALGQIPQAWEISYADDPEPGFSGWEHSYQKESGDLVKSKPFPIRRLVLKHLLDDFIFNADFIALIGNNARGEIQLVDFDIRRTLLEYALGKLDIANGVSWQFKQQNYLAAVHQDTKSLSVVNSERGERVKWFENIAIKAPLFSHNALDYLLLPLDNHPPQFAVLDKSTLQLGQPIHLPEAFQIQHIQYQANLDRLLLQSEREVIFLDPHHLQRIKRLPLAE